MATFSRFRDALLLSLVLWFGLTVSLFSMPVPLPVSDVVLLVGIPLLSVLIGFGVLYIGADKLER